MSANARRGQWWRWTHRHQRLATNDPSGQLRLRRKTQSVVFRSAPGSKFYEGLGSGTAAFEIDGTDPVERTGWSVIIVGEAKEVTDPAEIERLEGFEIEPWAPGLRTHWVRICATSVSGRRIIDRDKWGLR